MTEQAQRWPSFGYQPVRGLYDRILSRYLRTQRKNMRRLFEERGMFALADRMNQIRKSRQPMRAKNRYFQEVLIDYAKLITAASSAPAGSDGPAVPGALPPPPEAAGGAPEATDP